MTALCRECGEPPHYHSFCTLCCQLFMAGKWVRRWSPERIEILRRLLRVEGLTYRQAAAHLDVTAEAIRTAVRDHLRKKAPTDANTLDA